MSHQWHWADWWKLWMFHSAVFDPETGLHFNVRAFGPLQWSYWNMRGSFESRSYVRGRNHAYQAIRMKGDGKAADELWNDRPYDYNHPFDRGIIDVFQETHGQKPIKP